MSERYGQCPKCDGFGSNSNGTECYLCGGTGFDGSIDAYEAQAYYRRSNPIIKMTLESRMNIAVASVEKYLTKKGKL